MGRRQATSGPQIKSQRPAVHAAATDQVENQRWDDPSAYVPKQIGPLVNHQTDLPRIARDAKLTRLIEEALRQVPTNHHLYLGDARDMSALPPDSVHLVVTSPPYWTLKEYRISKGQLGFISD